jgi:hypothetical protein
MRRVITKREEQAYRLCHPDFGHCPLPKVAAIMGVSEREIQRLLASVKRKAPQLFEEPPRVPRGKVLPYSPNMDERVVRKF